MKKIISILTAMLLVIALLPTGVFAEGDTPSTPTDEKYFKTTDIDGGISIIGLTDDCKETNIVVPEKINNENVLLIDLSNTNISSLDLSHNTALTELDCPHCENLTSLDLSHNTALTKLHCYDCQNLTSLDLSHNTAFTYLDFEDCQNLTSLDLSKNILLTKLEFSNTNISSLDLSHNKVLTTLYCYNCQNLTSLDLSYNTALKYLDCHSSKNITSLDLSHKTQLANVVCSNCNINSLILPEDGKINILYCEENKLKELDFNGNTSMSDLKCNDNNFTQIDISSLTNLVTLNCQNNYLTSLDISHNAKLNDTRYFQCQNNCLPDAEVKDKKDRISGLTDANCGNQQCLITYDPLDNTQNKTYEKVTPDSTYTLIDNMFTAPAKKEFFRWNKNNMLKKPGNTFTVTENTTITPVWEDIKYPITVNNGSADVTENSVGNIVTINADNISGKRFTEWTSSDVTFADKTKASTTFTMKADPVTVTANYVDTCNVTFDSNNGIAVTTKTVDKNNTITELTATKTGYSFDGWYNGNTKFDFTTPITDNISLTAHWKINNYTVTFDANDGSAVADKTANYNTTITEPTTTKTGYSFDGWYNGDTEFNFNTPITENTDLTAKWTINKYDVTFSDEVTPQKIDYNNKATKPTDPEKTGYTFDGWYNGVDEFDFTTPITDNISLTAHWTANKYDVALHDNDATTCDTLESYIYNTGATLPIPTKTGYTFDGWYDNAEFSGDVITQISATDTGDKTFYAKWTANKYDVTLNTDNATTCDKLESYTYNTGTTLPIPTKTGYTFNGWYDNAEFSGDATTKITDTDIGNKEFYAKWERTKLNMLDGENQSWTQGSKDGLTFRSEADFSDFENVTVNDTILDENNYTKKSGSTIITLKPEYLETLSTGTYTIVINSTTGAATTTFEIKAKAVVPTNPTVPTNSSNPTNTTDKINATSDNKTISSLASVSNKSEKSKNPKTGSNASLSLIILSGLSLACFVFTKKKSK